MFSIKKMSIKGDFFDCQFHRGYLYLWDMDGILSVYNWQKYLALFDVNRKVDICIKHLEPIMEGYPVLVPGGLFPTDTAFIDGYLYTATESGLYRGSAINGAYRRSKYFTSSRPHKVWDYIPISLDVNNKRGLMAISTGEEGLYELNHSSIKTVGLKKKEKKIGIYTVSPKNIIRSRYVKNSILSSDVSQNKILFEFSVKKGTSGSMRQYIKEYNMYDSLYEKALSFAGDRTFSNISQVTSRGLELYPLYRNQKKLRKEPIVMLTKTTYKLLSVEPVSIGNVIETDKGLLVLLKDNKCFEVNQLVTRWRWFDPDQKQSLFFAVLEDKLDIFKIDRV